MKKIIEYSKSVQEIFSYEKEEKYRMKDIICETCWNCARIKLHFFVLCSTRLKNYFLPCCDKKKSRKVEISRERTELGLYANLIWLGELNCYNFFLVRLNFYKKILTSSNHDRVKNKSNRIKFPHRNSIFDWFPLLHIFVRSRQERWHVLEEGWQIWMNSSAFQWWGNFQEFVRLKKKLNIFSNDLRRQAERSQQELSSVASDDVQ